MLSKILVLILSISFILSGCTTVRTSTEHLSAARANTDERGVIVVVPGFVRAERVLSDSSISDRPMITETNDFTASRLSESIALELESSLRRIGYKVKIAEGEEAAPLIEKTADAYGKTVEKILKNVYTSKRSGGFEYDIGPEVKALGKIFSADLVVLAAMTARSKSNASWQQNFKDAAAQAAVFGTAPLFTRNSVDLHVAVVDARTGKISWFNTRSSHTLFKDGTTPAATRRLVAETFRPYMK